MKTPQEIIDNYEPNDEYPSYYHESSIEMMMKEYAKQWIERSAIIADESNLTGAPLRYEIHKLKKEIDEQ